MSEHFVHGWKAATPMEEAFSYFKRMDDAERQKPQYMQYSECVVNNLDKSHFYERRREFFKSLRQRKGL